MNGFVITQSMRIQAVHGSKPRLPSDAFTPSFAKNGGPDFAADVWDSAPPMIRNLMSFTSRRCGWFRRDGLAGAVGDRINDALLSFINDSNAEAHEFLNQTDAPGTFWST